jgi:hypothetical protein
MKFIAAFLFLLFLSAPALAQEMTFGWPAACEPGVDCWIINHLDRNPAQGAVADYACGHLAYDTHDGTDIGIRDRNHQIDVLAAADGVVKKARNDQADHDGGRVNTDPARASRTECGNAVLIVHENGWRTFYCHMRQGSVIVEPGQAVSKGEKLGEIGQSGLADFPHLHLEVLKGTTSIDPFTGEAEPGCGAGTGGALWDRPVAYNPVALYAAGFSEGVPRYEQVVKDTASPQTVSSRAPMLVFWFLGIGGEPRDRIALQVTDPSGKIVASSDNVQEKRQIRIMRYTGIKNKTGRLAPGVYAGIAALTRVTPEGETITRTVEQTVTVR